MLTLNLPAEPYWLDLPRGVRVEIRPVTTAIMAAAQAAAARHLAAIRLAGPDLDPDMSRGLYPGDRFFEFVPALQEAEIRLPAR